MPSENLAAQLIREHEAGYTSPPGHDAAIIEKARMLAEDAPLRLRLGQNGRAYASTAFDITTIGNRFSEILSDLVAG